MHGCTQNPLPLAQSDRSDLDTILSDATIKVLQTEVTLTQVHVKAKNVTNHD